MRVCLKYQILLAVLCSHTVIALKAPPGYRTPNGRVIEDANIEIPARAPINLDQWMIDLGTVEGRSYYADLEQMMNWTQARDYCISRFMTLATIDSVVQFNFLVDALEPFEAQNMWVAARESRHGQTMNIWDRGDKINETVAPDWGHQYDWEPYHYCGTFWANGREWSQFWTDHCDRDLFTYALCQLGI